MSLVSKKRPADSEQPESGPSTKRARPDAAVAWAKLPLGYTILYGTHLNPNESATKAAVFDLDGTVIKTKGKLPFARNADDWQWWSSTVTAELARLAQEGFHIVLLTNQAGLTTDKKRVEWKRKVENIARELDTLPFTIIAATAKDGFRKPSTRMWTYLQTRLGCKFDVDQSFFVGDAAGRPRDHGDSDKKFAVSIGIKFYTPEEYFPAEPAKSQSVRQKPGNAS